MPIKTKIDYFIAGLTAVELAAYNSGTMLLSDLSFNSIEPIGRSNPSEPISLNFLKLAPLSGITSSYSKTFSIPFRYNSNTNALIDYVVPSTIEKSEMKILRNIGDNILGSGGQPVKVKGTTNGWRFSGTSYSSNFYINEDSGKTIDFGPNDLFIDRLKVNGKVFLTKGFHRIRTDKKNWRTFDPSAILTTDNPEILYPYNHKYLIEGISNTLYGEDLSVTVGGKTKLEIIDPLNVYLGSQRYWEKTLEEITSFSFLQDIDKTNYDTFSFTTDLSGAERIMIKDSLEPGLLIDEKIAIITRTVSSDLHTAIVLKAIFSSGDARTTPVLDEYIVRLGL